MMFLFSISSNSPVFDDRKSGNWGSTVIQELSLLWDAALIQTGLWVTLVREIFWSRKLKQTNHLRQTCQIDSTSVECCRGVSPRKTQALGGSHQHWGRIHFWSEHYHKCAKNPPLWCPLFCGFNRVLSYFNSFQSSPGFSESGPNSDWSH